MAFAAKHDSLDALNADLQKIDPSKAVAFKVALIRQLTETASTCRCGSRTWAAATSRPRFCRPGDASMMARSASTRRNLNPEAKLSISRLKCHRMSGGISCGCGSRAALAIGRGRARRAAARADARHLGRRGCR